MGFGFFTILGNVKVDGEGCYSTSKGNIKYGIDHGGSWMLDL